MLLSFKSHKGVYYITQRENSFSNIYIDVRKKEERFYSDAIVKRLPYVPKTHRYYQEWKLRQKSSKRLIEYITAKNAPLKILDIGCGNGWFSHQLSGIPDSEIFGLDINDIELEQAARVFSKPNLKFIYADIFSSEALTASKGFDIITVNSCIQYFSDLSKIVDTLTQKLTMNGELHIFDSPFYDASDIDKAKERTKAYYEELGFPKMTEHYFHHRKEDIKEFKILYKPKRKAISRILGKTDSPFMWVKYTNKGNLE